MILNERKENSDGRVRVAQLIWNGVGGGAERALRNLAKRLDRESFEIRFYFLYSLGADAEAIESFGFNTYFVAWKNWFSFAGRVRLIKLLKNFRPHVIHVHTCPPLTRCLLRWFVPGARLIFSEHGNIADMARMLPRYHPSVLLNKYDFRSGDLVVVYSQWMADIVRREYGISTDSVRVLPLGVDRMDNEATDFGREGVPIDDKGSDWRIGYVGRIVNAQKGTDLLPRIARVLIEKGCDDFEIVVVGDGPDRNGVSDMAHQLGVADKVRVVGWQQDVSRWFSSFDVVVVPSRFEPFGMVVAEALMSDVRVVAFDVGGIREATGGCEDAVLVEPQNIEAIADAILMLRNNYGKNRSPGSRKLIASKFSVERMVLATESVYRELVCRPE